MGVVGERNGVCRGRDGGGQEWVKECQRRLRCEEKDEVRLGWERRKKRKREKE